MEKIRIAIIALLLLTTKTLGDPIHTAAKTGNLAGVKAEIEDGEDVDIPNLSNFDLTPLHYAAAYGHLEILEYLIQEGADLEVTDTLEGATALHWAAFYGHLDVVKSLTENDADITAMLRLGNNSGDTPLDVSIRELQPEITAYLLENNAIYSNIFYAILNGDIDAVNGFIDDGFDVNEKDPRWYDYTSLHHAASWGHIKIIKMLLQKGAKINLRDSDQGATPLILASYYNRPIAVRTLLENGADSEVVVLIGIYKDYTPLDIAELSNFNEVINELKTKNAQYNKIFYAAQGGDLEGVKRIVNTGIDINSENPNWANFTALLHGSVRGRSDIVDYLITNGASLTATDNLAGATALHWATYNGHLETVKILVNQGAKLDTKIKSGEHQGLTAVELAEKENHNDIVEFLENSGGKLNENSILTRVNYLTKKVNQLEHLILGSDNPQGNGAPSIEKLQGIFVINGNAGETYEVQYHTGDNNWKLRELIELQGDRQLYLDSSSYDQKRFYRIKELN
jgi:ankyrin repeat protein